MANPSLVNYVRRAAMAGLAAILALLAWASPSAAADSGNSGVVATGGGRLNVRDTPSLSGKVIATQNNGARVVLVCQVKGEKVNGTHRTTTMWNKLQGGGYISDAFTKRGKVPPRCTTKAETPEPKGGATEWRRPLSAKIWSGFHTKARPDHDGVDLGAPRGARIRAAADGTVIVAMCNASTNNCDKDGSPKVMGCGWYVDIRHAGGIITRYCHMVSKPDVKVGQKVSRDEVLGRVGSSGNSSGPHLHFEVHVPPKAGAAAKPVDPIEFFADKGIELDVQ
jgi:murein DD-endopeptidase MepM/ murein hydrolase activator NlpD